MAGGSGRRFRFRRDIALLLEQRIEAAVLHHGEQMLGHGLRDAMSTMDAFVELIQGRGQVEPDEEVLEDAVAFAGVARYPARVKCALLGWMAFKDAVSRADGGKTQ